MPLGMGPAVLEQRTALLDGGGRLGKLLGRTGVSPGDPGTRVDSKAQHGAVPGKSGRHQEGLAERWTVGAPAVQASDVRGSEGSSLE